MRAVSLRWVGFYRRHGPIHLQVASAIDIGFQWDPLVVGWVRPWLPVLSNLAGPVQH